MLPTLKPPEKNIDITPVEFEFTLNNTYANLLVYTLQTFITYLLSLQMQNKMTADLIKCSTAEILDSNRIEAKRIIDSQKLEIEQLTLALEEQRSSLCFLELEERTRKLAAKELSARREQLKNRKKKAVRDGATLPEFIEAIKIIDSKPYKIEFVRSREKISLLLLFLTGIRVANLCEVTASNLECLLTDEKSTYFQVNAIKSRKRVVYSTLLTSVSLDLAKKYKNDILVLLKNKEPNDYVFTSEESFYPLERAALTKRLNAILKPAGKVYGKNISSHSFRIGHITVLIDQFGLLHAQKLIGHQNSETTLRYARNKLETNDFANKMRHVETQKHTRILRYKRSHIKNN